MVFELAYRGMPPAVTDPDGTQGGLVPDRSRCARSRRAARGTATWIPCNNVPGDKAVFSFKIDVPRGLTAIANGWLHPVVRHQRLTVYKWSESNPMSSYLAVLDIGRGRFVKSRAGGTPRLDG